MGEVDLSKLKKGDEVELRCGGKIIAKANWPNFNVCFFNDRSFVQIKYSTDGTVDPSGEETPFDIIAIHKKPFDWAYVKAGMAFTDEDGDLVIYIGQNPYNDLSVAGFLRGESKKIYLFPKSDLTRAPEHDIEVK
jgi:hypothetical protein